MIIIGIAAAGSPSPNTRLTDSSVAPSDTTLISPLLLHGPIPYNFFQKIGSADQTESNHQGIAGCGTSGRTRADPETSSLGKGLTGHYRCPRRGQPGASLEPTKPGRTVFNSQEQYFQPFIVISPCLNLSPGAPAFLTRVRFTDCNLFNRSTLEFSRAFWLAPACWARESFQPLAAADVASGR